VQSGRHADLPPFLCSILTDKALLWQGGFVKKYEAAAANALRRFFSLPLRAAERKTAQSREASGGFC